MTDWGIIAARLLQFGPALVLMGAPLFYLYGFKGGAAEWLSRRWTWPNVANLGAAILALTGAVLWLLAETALIFSDPGAFGADALWTVMTGTGFGRIAFLRVLMIATFIVAWFLLTPGRTSWSVQSLLGTAVVMSFAWTGHGIKDEGIPGIVHTSGDVLHLLTAAIWIGALVPLTVMVLKSLGTQSATAARLTYDALERFSGVGPAVVAVLVLSGLVNTWFLIGPARLLTATTTIYGQLLVVKLSFFTAMMALATVNRFWLSPNLASALENGERIAKPLEALRRSIVIETALAMLVLFAVSWMGTLEPVQT